MIKLSTEQNKAIEEYWIDLNGYKKQLSFREWELTEQKSDDENIGGGKSNRISDTTARKAIILAEDERYQYLKRIINAVEQTYSELDGELKVFADMRYFSPESRYCDWEDVADELSITKSKAYKLRNKLIDETAKKLGMI